MDPMVKFDLTFFKGKRVLVTGDTGFKGSWLSLFLWQIGASVTGYSLPPKTDLDHFVVINLKNKINHIDGDLSDIELLKRTVRECEPEIVFHLAAQPLVRRSYEDPIETFKTNVLGSVNLLECVRSSDTVRSLIFVTSDKCYKNKEWIWGYRETDELGGHDPYSASKAAAEIVFESYRLSFFNEKNNIGVASVRAGNVIGGGDWSTDRIIPDCVRSLVENRPIMVRNPSATRPWQHVLEPIYGYMQLAAALWENPGQFSGSWNFGPNSGSHKTVIDLVGEVIKDWGSGQVIIGDSSHEVHEAGFLHLNCDKSQNYLGWYPVWGFIDTVKETIDWYMALNKENKSLQQILDFVKERNNNDSRR